MKLGKWVSNHQSLLKDSQISKYTFVCEANAFNRFGMLWELNLHNLTKFEVDSRQGITERDVLSTIARFYDP